MSTRSLLVNFVGYPTSLRGLVPENGLASLASCLIDSGHETTILDYATVDMVRRLFPRELSGGLERLSDAVSARTRKGLEPAAEDMEAFGRLDARVGAWEREQVLGIAREIDTVVKARQVDFVGFKLWWGDGFEGSLTIARYLKEANPGLAVFGGGPHVDSFRQRILDLSPFLDAVVYGEGEESIVALAECVEGKRALASVPNVIYRENGSVRTTPPRRVRDLNTLPYPVYDEDVYPAMAGDEKLRIAVVEESRGCPNACSFCIHPYKSGRRRRSKSASVVVDQMDALGEACATSAFRFSGSNPPAPLADAVALERLARGRDSCYVSFAHVEATTPERLRLLRDSGCYGLYYGMESGSQTILNDSINKRTDTGQIRSALAAATSAGLFTVASVIIPAPLETEETKRETMDLLREVRPDSVIVWVPVLMPETEWGRNPGRYGFEAADPEAMFRELMVYRVKPYYPRALWPPCPGYQVHGKSFRGLALEAGAFAEKLEEDGLLTDVTHDAALIAHYAGCSAREFRDRDRRLLARGDHETVEGLVETVNRAVRAH